MDKNNNNKVFTTVVLVMIVSKSSYILGRVSITSDNVSDVVTLYNGTCVQVQYLNGGLTLTKP